jgi:leucyl aminopeptidase (aminopeptidase T)
MGAGLRSPETPWQAGGLVVRPRGFDWEIPSITPRSSRHGLGYGVVWPLSFALPLSVFPVVPPFVTSLGHLPSSSLVGNTVSVEGSASMLSRGPLVGVGLFVLIILTACSGANPPAPAQPPAAAPAPAAQATAPEPPKADYGAVAKTMVRNALVKPGDHVVVSGNVRDKALLEELVIETMKTGALPFVTFSSDSLQRRSYDEVSASFDSQPRTFETGFASLVDVQLSVDASDSENVLAGVPPERIAARAKAGLPVIAAAYKKGQRMVSLGNGLYPTAALAARLGKPLADVEAMFWKAVTVPPEALRAKGEPLRDAFKGAKTLTLSGANGTKITFGVDATKAAVSDGALTPEKVKAGMASPQTWLPAGEVLIPVTAGTGDGTIVIDKMVLRGTMIEGLTLTFAKGKLTAMTAKSGLQPLKAYYDASSGGKDVFGYIDLGVNPEAQFPADTGQVVWVAPGAVTIGVGDNTGWSGTNVSSFGLAGAVTKATLSVDGKVLIENGVLK